VFDFLHDQNFLSALAAMIGPIAFFAAPTEEIEALLFVDVDGEVAREAIEPAYPTPKPAFAEAA
jgi:hypothetical protein